MRMRIDVRQPAKWLMCDVGGSVKRCNTVTQPVACLLVSGSLSFNKNVRHDCEATMVKIV